VVSILANSQIKQSKRNGFALSGGELLQNSLRDLLDFSEARQILLEFVIQQLRVLRAQLVPQDHVPQLHRVRQQRVFLQFFERLARLVVLHGSLPPNRAPSNVTRL